MAYVKNKSFRAETEVTRTVTFNDSIKAPDRKTAEAMAMNRVQRLYAGKGVRIETPRVTELTPHA